MTTDRELLQRLRDELATEGAEAKPVTPDMADALDRALLSRPTALALYVDSLATQIGEAWKAIDEHIASNPKPYRCTVTVEMPADDGHATRPEDVTEALSEMGVEVVEWHDEDLLEHPDEED